MYLTPKDVKLVDVIFFAYRTGEKTATDLEEDDTSDIKEDVGAPQHSSSNYEVAATNIT